MWIKPNHCGVIGHPDQFTGDRLGQHIGKNGALLVGQFAGGDASIFHDAISGVKSRPCAVLTAVQHVRKRLLPQPY
jgi:hypothetical protein